MRAVAILPARGGSKRIPFKNGRDFCGRPMMGWPIAAARDSGLFDRIVVSTDDDRLAELAAAEGAEVPFRRDAGLADDHTGTTEVIADAVARLGLAPETPVACLYPTAAFTTADDLREAARRLDAGATWVFAAAEFPEPVDRSYIRTPTGFAARWPERMPMRSQDLAPAFYDAGQFYMARAGTWTTPGARVWDGADAIVLPRARAVDIDTPEDWAMAETLFRLAGLAPPAG
jgi:N-acylneuraminate cytidylyltransferase